jgi:hypothetical protein
MSQRKVEECVGMTNPYKTTGKISYKTIISKALFHKCETWSLILREENRLKVLEEGY